jgi:hypothetical protein
MKLLMFTARRFWYRTFEKTLPEAPDQDKEEDLRDVVLAFIHVEPADAGDWAGVRTKLVKNIKWLANKWGFRRVLLHSFTHLAEEKAEPALAQQMIEETAERLRGAGYQVSITPFGYLCEWDLHVYGESLGRVFKAL